MKRGRIQIWEWVTWVIAILLVVFAMLTTFALDNLGAGILLAVVLALILCVIIYRIDHPEKYDQVVGWFTGSMTGKLVGGLLAVRPGKPFELSLERDDLLLSDGHREKYSLLYANIIDAEALSGKETQVWKAKQPETDANRYARTNPGFTDKIRDRWSKWFDRYLIINYRDRNTDETRAMIFQYRGDLKGKKFAEELRHRAALGSTALL